MTKFLLILFAVISCTQSDSNKFIRRKTINDDIELKWYYYSYISNQSPDIVEVVKDNQSIEVLKAEGIIANVLVNNKQITIKMYNPKWGIIYTKNVLNEVFGYKIILDSSSTYIEYKNRPNGIKDSLSN